MLFINVYIFCHSRSWVHLTWMTHSLYRFIKHSNSSNSTRQQLAVLLSRSLQSGCAGHVVPHLLYVWRISTCSRSTANSIWGPVFPFDINTQFVRKYTSRIGYLHKQYIDILYWSFIWCLWCVTRLCSKRNWREPSVRNLLNPVCPAYY